MTAAGPVRLGVVGCGRVAHEHLAAYRRLAEARLVAVVDIDETLARRVAADYGGAAYTDYRRMLDTASVEALLVCTPPSTHAEIMLEALSRGIHVLCEKPLTITLKEAMQVWRIVRRTPAVLMMASKFRFVEDVVKAKAVLDAGLLGRLVLFENVFCSRVDMRNRWNCRREIAGGGVLIDNGTHSVDLARFLLGPITAVQAQFGIQVQEIEVEDTCRLYFQSASGVMGTIDVSWSIQKDTDNYATLFGTEGTLALGWRESKYRRHAQSEWVVFGDGYDKQAAFINQARHFLGCVRGEDTPLLTPLDGLESVRVIEAAYRSSLVNKWMALESLEAEESVLHEPS